MAKLCIGDVKSYLSHLFEEDVSDVSIRGIGVEDVDMKGFGYGRPFIAKFKVNGVVKKVVLGTMKGDSFGHEFQYDRAQSLLMAFQTFNKLPRHVKALDAGVITQEGALKSVGGFEEFFLVTEKVEGTDYYKDLERIKENSELTTVDLERCVALSSYLVDIHSKKLDRPSLYRRRIRELLGHGECIMGLIDNYPSSFKLIGKTGFKLLEQACLEWRWKIRDKTSRLSQVHGDYHPWNILFREGVDFTVLDRSRGEWGEPADDLATMTINYLFYSLNAYGQLSGPFERLFKEFFSKYVEGSGDEDVVEVIQPFYAWRGLVLASPLWYPSLSADIRRRIFNFINNVLRLDVFMPDKVNDYLEG